MVLISQVLVVEDPLKVNVTVAVEVEVMVAEMAAQPHPTMMAMMGKMERTTDETITTALQGHLVVLHPATLVEMMMTTRRRMRKKTRRTIMRRKIMMKKMNYC